VSALDGHRAPEAAANRAFASAGASEAEADTKPNKTQNTMDRQPSSLKGLAKDTMFETDTTI
jgi:hypothetical protein